MQDDNNALPEGTDTVIEGAANNTGAIVTDRASGDSEGGTITVEETAAVIDREIVEPGSNDINPAALTSAGPGAGASEGRLADRLRGGREKLAGQAGERARGFVTQGLERTAETLANVSRMVGDTANGIEERLGADYGDYARRAASAIENTANSIAAKDPDELIDDTRTFVRNSPGVALAGAAVVGFVLARLVKSGLGAGADAYDPSYDDADREDDRA
jgi:ElaB/YqjD/DUF883 family membrane-anchored ribosome-binding protein